MFWNGRGREKFNKFLTFQAVRKFRVIQTAADFAMGFENALAQIGQWEWLVGYINAVGKLRTGAQRVGEF